MLADSLCAEEPAHYTPEHQGPTQEELAERIALAKTAPVASLLYMLNSTTLHQLCRMCEHRP